MIFAVDSRTQTIVARRHATQPGSRSLVAERSRSPGASNQTHFEVFRSHRSITHLPQGRQLRRLCQGSHFAFRPITTYHMKMWLTRALRLLTFTTSC